MDFEFAYDLEVELDNEVVLVKSDDRHRKIRVWVKSIDRHTEDTIVFGGHSLGSSVKEIKAAKKDEIPVPVTVSMTLTEGRWRGNVTGQ